MSVAESPSRRVCRGLRRLEKSNVTCDTIDSDFFNALLPIQQFISPVGISFGLYGLNQYLAGIKCPAQGHHRRRVLNPNASLTH